jgi:hypothetical protein
MPQIVNPDFQDKKGRAFIARPFGIALSAKITWR